jgi:ATP-dependent RNA helicase RhlE
MTDAFGDLALCASLQQALIACAYHIPTPIQRQAIPPLLAGRDLLGIAQTGTGKTAAFALPILERLAATQPARARGSVRALVLAPTRELAAQIAENMRAFGRFMQLSQAVVYGGVGLQPQINAVRRGVDVLIATPGRLMDLMAQGHIRLDAVSILVLDEADRMLDIGFLPAVERIVKALPKLRQSICFSATMPPEVARLCHAVLKDPVRIEVTPSATTAERIDQRVYFVETANKRALLEALLQDQTVSRVLVFTRTKRGADRVAEQLMRSGFEADAIHGNKSQNARQRALAALREGKLRVLVATDIAARGIDITGITHVINYELPDVPDSYVHRVGRTARAGAEGIAISLCSGSERAVLRDIERLTGIALTVVEPPPFRAAPASALVQHQPRLADPRRRDGRAQPLKIRRGPRRQATKRAGT